MVASSLTVRSAIGSRVGAGFTSATTIVIVSVALNGGEPLSVTRTVMRLVDGPWASVGVQVNTPLFGSIAAPAGAPAANVNGNACAGRSGSVADAVKESNVASLTALLPIGFSTGSRLTSVTMTMNVVVSLWFGAPSSVTRMVIRLVLGPCASEGVHVKRPLVWLMEAPAGAPASRLN